MPCRGRSIAAGLLAALLWHSSAAAEDAPETSTVQDGEATEEERPLPPRREMRRPGVDVPWEADTPPSDEELQEQGWMFLDESAEPGRAIAGLLAATVGLAAHGIGHLLIGDDETALRLFIGQGLSMVMFATGLTMRQIAPREPAMVQAADAVAVSGVGLFAITWAADVVGAFRGTGTPAAAPPFEPDGVTAEFAISRLFSQGMLERDQIGLSVPVKLPALLVHPTLDLDVRLRYWRTHLLVGPRFELGPHASLQALALGDEERGVDGGWGRTRLGGEGVLRMDTRLFAPHLAGLIWEQRVGVVAESFHLDAVDGGARFRADATRWQVPVETSLELGISTALHLTAGYRHRDDLLVGTLSDHVGVLWGRVGIIPRNRIGAALMLEQGAFFRAWVGFRWVVIDRSEAL